MLASAASIIASLRAKLAPPPDVRGSEWADRYRILSPESSSQPGPFRINKTPYMREILDLICGGHETIEEVWIIKASQLAFSENLNNAIGYHMHLDPGPMMMIQPTLEMGEDYSKDRIEPMLRDCETLAELTDFREKKSGNTILRKKFPGGLLRIIGANSPASLASRPIRWLCCDEVDRYPMSAGKEGDPIELGRARQATYESNRMLVAGGTPVLKGASRTEKGYDTTDKRVYMVECPHCHTHIAFEWENFQQDPEKPNYAEYQCQSCNEFIAHSHKYQMIKDKEAGGTAYWQATATCPDTRAGFFIWTAYSPFRSWRYICDKWQEVKGDPEREQTFYNTVLGRAYSYAAQDLDAEELFKQREAIDLDALPDDILVVTAGIDTQDNRFEIEVVGWGFGEESWSLSYHQIIGDPEIKATRQALDDWLAEQVYTRADGTKLKIKAAFVDSGGHRTDSVYTFARGKRSRHIYACKGANVAGQPIFARFSYQKKARVHLAIVGTDTAKETIYARLANPDDTAGRCHFPLTYDLEYFRQLTAEEKVIEWRNGVPRVVFKKKEEEQGKRERNEPLDCRVYALAALRSLNTNLRVLKARDMRRKAKQKDDPPNETAKPKPKETAEKAEKSAKKRAKRPARRRPRSSWLRPR